MSADTAQTLDNAIRAHIADEHPDALLSEWILVAAAIEPGTDRGDMLHIYEDSDLPSHHATGLLTRMANIIEHNAVTTHGE